MGQNQLLDETRLISILGFGASFIRNLMVIQKQCFDDSEIEDNNETGVVGLVSATKEPVLLG